MSPKWSTETLFAICEEFSVINTLILEMKIGCCTMTIHQLNVSFDTEHLTKNYITVLPEPFFFDPALYRFPLLKRCRFQKGGRLWSQNLRSSQEKKPCKNASNSATATKERVIAKGTISRALCCKTC
jgi:hypothetical protein